LIKLFCYTGRDGEIGLMGFHGLDGQKGKRGDIGISVEGRPGDKGKHNLLY
jgi:hypothetical protein